MLDGFERQLRAFSSLNAAYQGDNVSSSEKSVRAGGAVSDRDCVNPLAEHFLRGVAVLPNLHSKVLMTTRLSPHALQVHGDVLLDGCREEELKQMQPADAVIFLREKGMRGSRAEIEAICETYGYHPLSFSLLVGLIANDLRQPGDIAVARRLDVSGDLIQRQHHVLQQSYDSLTSTRQQLLSRIACFRGAVSYETMHTLADKENEGRLDSDLRDLLARGFLHRDDKTNRFDLHPIVRRYAYDRLTTNDRTAAHIQLRDYFAAVPTPSKVQTLDDLQPVIELYHHTVCAGQYDKAAKVFYDRLHDACYFQFGAYQLIAELLSALFPDGEDHPPRLKYETWQAWALNALANSYALSGQPRRAVPLFEQHNAIYEKAGNKKNLATGLGNVAVWHKFTSAPSAPPKPTCADISTCAARSRTSSGRPSGSAELGRLLAYRGVWDRVRRRIGNGAHDV